MFVVRPQVAVTAPQSIRYPGKMTVILDGSAASIFSIGTRITASNG
jgi:hypothetical protein